MKVGDLVRFKINMSSGKAFYRAGELGVICQPQPEIEESPISFLYVYTMHQKTGTKSFIAEMYLEKVS